MSLYDINRACGHVEQVQIKGTNVRGERERKARYMEQFDCSACEQAAKTRQQAELAARATDLATISGWPNLTGSPKQVPWAQDVRASLLAELVARICDQVDDELMRLLDRLLQDRGHAGDLRDWGTADTDQIASVYITAALRQTEARWWIDRRGLAMRPRNQVDLIDTAGVAAINYGGLLGAVEAVMTDAERQQLATLLAGAAR